MIPIPTMIAKLLICAGVLLVTFGSGWHYGAKGVRSDWDAEKANELQAQKSALIARINENDKILEQQEIDRQKLKKGYANEITKLRATYDNSERLRINARICDGSAESGDSKSASGSNGGTPGSRELPADIDRDLKSLGEKYETAIAGCRVAQAFIRDNGMAP